MNNFILSDGVQLQNPQDVFDTVKYYLYQKEYIVLKHWVIKESTEINNCLSINGTAEFNETECKVLEKPIFMDISVELSDNKKPTISLKECKISSEDKAPLSSFISYCEFIDNHENPKEKM